MRAGEDEHFPSAVVPDAVQVTAPRRHDLVEQSNLGVTVVHDVKPVGFDGAFEDSPFVSSAASGVGAGRRG